MMGNLAQSLRDCFPEARLSLDTVNRSCPAIPINVMGQMAPVSMAHGPDDITIRFRIVYQRHQFQTAEVRDHCMSISDTLNRRIVQYRVELAQDAYIVSYELKLWEEIKDFVELISKENIKAAFDAFDEEMDKLLSE